MYAHVQWLLVYIRLQELEERENSSRNEVALDSAAREEQWVQIRARARACEESQRQVDEQV